MKKEQVNSAEEALCYLTDCCLATVGYMASLKNKSTGEFKRQINIAQLACNWMAKFGIDPKGTRAEDIIGKRSVEEWTKPLLP